ncbi:MAG: type II secretion system F family protein, partial [Verrucomicrobiota bacterium]|nr:type II secretion system F family protein [Verrucomicrobiota bacterium]
MPEFKYTAVTPEGQLFNGKYEAENVGRLKEMLAKDGLELVNSEVSDRKSYKRQSRLKMKPAELANLIFQIGIQLRAGVPIVEALRPREGEDSSDTESTVRQRLSEMVEQGTPLSKGFESFPQIFPGYICNIVKVAEMSGSVDQNFIELRDYLEWMDQNWKSFKQAMLYPAFVMAALVIFIFIALRFVFPTVTELLFELNIPLPWITQFMISASDFVVEHWGWILAVFFLTPPGLRLLFRVSEKAALLRDHFLIRIPFLGNVILTLAVARFLRSLILMQKAGIVITDSLSMSREVVGNKVIEHSVIRIERAVSNGSTISSCMAK